MITFVKTNNMIHLELPKSICNCKPLKKIIPENRKIRNTAGGSMSSVFYGLRFTGGLMNVNLFKIKVSGNLTPYKHEIYNHCVDLIKKGKTLRQIRDSLKNETVLDKLCPGWDEPIKNTLAGNWD